MRTQRGISAGPQWALLFPVAFGAFLLVLQWAVYAWAQASALAAAQDGAAQAATYQSTEKAGREVALRAADNGSLDGIQIVVTRGTAVTEVTVSGSAPSLLPGVDLVVSRTALVPTERLVP